MTGEIQALTNMEYLLYGNSPYYGNTAAPSMFNNYCAPTNNSMYGYMNPYMYGAYNQAFGQNTAPYASAENNNPKENSIFTGLNKNEQDAIINDYAKSLSPSESLLSSAAGATVFSVLFHPRVIAHPFNTKKSFGLTKTLFADVTQKGTKLAEGWANPGTNKILRDAYTAMNRIDARSLKKDNGLHILRKALTKDEYRYLREDVMDKALKNFDINNEGSIKELIKATETLNQANVKDGIAGRAMNWFKNLGCKITGKEPVKITSAWDAAHNSEAIEQAAQKAYEAAAGGEKVIAKGSAEALKAVQGGKTYLQTLKSSSGGIIGAAIMMGMEFIGSLGKIKAAFSKDKKTGWTQIGQTTVKGLGSAAGWAAGEALGTWGCAKLLAMAGTAVAPGVGTAIGAIAGMIVGSVGCCLAGKITKKLVGQDVGDKAQAEQLANTEDGQIQLLQNTVQRIQKGENVDPQAVSAMQKLYAAA